ncbi:hypothetical protein HanHA89_Chr16g0655021 [Helianthus annuus]|nr:hypothetical protein HanHA89_Chr16g0655021 [Helianthus annuus]
MEEFATADGGPTKQIGGGAAESGGSGSVIAAEKRPNPPPPVLIPGVKQSRQRDKRGEETREIDWKGREKRRCRFQKRTADRRRWCCLFSDEISGQTDDDEDVKTKTQQPVPRFVRAGFRSSADTSNLWKIQVIWFKGFRFRVREFWVPGLVRASQRVRIMFALAQLVFGSGLAVWFGLVTDGSFGFRFKSSGQRCQLGSDESTQVRRVKPGQVSQLGYTRSTQSTQRVDWSNLDKRGQL